MFGMAITVGLATGAAVLIFRYLIEWFNHVVSREFGQHLLGHYFETLGLNPNLQIVIVLTLAGAVVGSMMHWLVGDEKYHGIPSVIIAGWLGGGRLPYYKMPAKAVASALSLGAGASLGAEAPSVQIGANIGSFFGQKLHLDPESIRLLMAAGVASGIAAAFNAPISGVFFALEVILIGDLSVKASGVIMLAAVISSALTHAVRDAGPMFHDLSYVLGSPLQLVMHILLGVMLAIGSWAAIRYWDWQVRWMHDHWHWPLPLKTALTGTVIGLMGLMRPEILGPGEGFMEGILSGHITLGVGVLLLIAGVKLVATGISYGGGFVGGKLAPSLFLGIALGHAFGQVLNLFMPAALIGDAQSYAIAGMAGLLAGVIQAPITSILLVFELTNDYRIILPVMITSVTCIFGLDYLKTAGIYFTTLVREGVQLDFHRDIDVMQSVTVFDAMSVPAYTIHVDATLPQLRSTLRRYRVRSLTVLDDNERVVGVVTLGDLQRYYESHEGNPDGVQSCHVREVASLDVVTARPDMSMWEAIEIMGAYNVGRLPVIDPDNGALLGLVSRRAIIETYNTAIKRKVEESHHVEQVQLRSRTGATVEEFQVKQGMAIAGKRIRDLILPQHFIIASIQRGSHLIVPRGYTVIREGDKMTIVADPHVIDMIKTLFAEGPIAERVDMSILSKGDESSRG